MAKTVEVSFPGGKKVDAKIGDRLIRTDQSVKNGGEGSAPEPFELFLASIATCAGTYALAFCRSRNIPTEGMALRMVCHFDPEARLYRKMTIELTLPPGFPEDHEASIIRSMDLCAVKKHIVNAPEFEIRVRPYEDR